MVDLLTLTQYFASRGDVILLQSQSEDHPSSNVSYLAAQPESIIKAHGNQIIEITGVEEQQYNQNPWDALQSFRNRVDSWLFGYLGYDLKNNIEQLDSSNPDPVGAGDMYFMEPGFLLRYDHKSQKEELIIGDMPSKDEIIDSVISLKEECELGRLKPQTSRQRYIQKIEKSQFLITEGDFYEINLSHQMIAPFKGSALQLYQRMREIGPVPFGSFLQFDELSVCCQSPERFLRKKGSTVYSQPIKGTTKRGASINEDDILRKELLSSKKEQAENLMIVDLVRNDLSRIAKEGTVKVPELFDIQSFGTVHQMVSTVTAEAKEEDPVNILRACFPMGSMTGAPKISAMETIEELEDYKRGIYSGAIGYITPGGDFDFNVVIRTAIIKNNYLYYGVGGAITGDSDPQKEWEETQIKARALSDVFENCEEK
ncbi:aminodeoxychorismate synthase, component I [Aliifodinibius salipaludis]|uniref:aminodeoxychorismate synthase n=1 Tax=Fodinibius salipaludis TaxID=2032627 RepID=A0A2A2GEI9_9BACT|nr:aminodeoxychorismate synthase component I [Aliifodinibius salipaludis]PAU95630.1 aminodeoxychorismate synthase, component I [Aliifodinibius salipaludis]